MKDTCYIYKEKKKRKLNINTRRKMRKMLRLTQVDRGWTGAAENPRHGCVLTVTAQLRPSRGWLTSGSVVHSSAASQFGNV